jgi:hypothetical protein
MRLRLKEPNPNCTFLIIKEHDSKAKTAIAVIKVTMLEEWYLTE